MVPLDDNLYRILFLLHIVSIVAAFAPMVIHPALAAQARKDGHGTLVKAAGWMAGNGRRIHFPALILVGVFGLGMVFTSDPGSGENLFEFDQTWVSLSLLVWIGLCGVVSGLILPSERKVAAGDLSAEKAANLGGAISSVLFLVMLYLMIWKPGL